MMSVNSNKRRGRLNSNSNKLGKSKFYPPDKNMLCDGIYGNSKLMYTVASLVGCVVQIQVQNGTIFEGVLRTFSQQLDIVLEMAHKVNKSKSSLSTSTKGISPNVSNLIASYPFEGGIFDKLIFKLSDIILMVASTVDPDYAVKDNFTDTAISKFNGQVRERELEPWEDSISDGSDSELVGTNNAGFSIEDDEGTNGWDANDMFRTNAEKYGVQSSYDNSLQDYTVPLLKKDTEEWKLQEEKALKIAQEIETNNAYQSRIQLENNDDNEEDRFSAVVRTTDQDNSAVPPSKYVLPQKRRGTSFKRQHNNPSSKVYNSTVLPPIIPSQSLPQVFEEASVASAGCPNVTVPKSEVALNSPTADAPVVKESSDLPECSPHPLKHIPPPMSMQYSTQSLPPRIERRNREKLNSKHKGRTDEIEEFKKFSSNFKLTEDKDLREINEPILESSGEAGYSESAITTHLERTKIVDSEDSQAAANTSSIVKFSTLNPNAKEFVFNPNAKAFTPRSMSVVTPPVTQPPPPPPHQEQNIPPPMMPPPQPIFTGVMAAPQYHVMQTNIPVSVSAITSPFGATQSVPQPPPRFRKTSGQPLLAPPPPPQQLYSSTMAPGSILHAVSAPQTTTLSGYPQMNFVVGPRVVSPQPVGVIPTSHSMSYCDTSHMPTTHFIMSTHPSVSSANPHTLHQGGQQHSSQHRPPQCQTPVTLHPSPSPPVHQVPPPSHSQPPTPTTIMYPGGTHPLHQAAAANHQHSQLVHMHPHGVAFPTSNLQPQQLVLMQHQPGSLNPSSFHMLHSQAAHHPMHLPQMAIMPTSAAMTTANTSPYLQHP